MTEDVYVAAALLREGKLVGIPTETVYGLGANALDTSAAAGIFAAKDRPAFDPLIIHQNSAERVFQYAREIPTEARTLADACWPGPLTLVLPKSDLVPDIVTAGLDTVAMRVPKHPLTLELLGRLDFPLAAPSANPFGFVSPTTAHHVLDQLGDRIDAVLNGGPCSVGLESTIVGFPQGRPTILRKGGLAIEDIEGLLGQSVDVREHGSSRPEAPGMLSSHYSPGCRITLLDSLVEHPSLQGREDDRIAIVSFGRFSSFKTVENGGQLIRYDLSPSRSLSEAAARLFGVLRNIKEEGVEEAWIELVPESGIGKAINDRLRRAAARKSDSHL